MLYCLLRLSCRKMEACPGLDLLLRQNGFQVIINDDFYEEGKWGVMVDNSYLMHSL